MTDHEARQRIHAASDKAIHRSLVKACVPAEPSLKEAIMELVIADQVEREYSARLDRMSLEAQDRELDKGHDIELNDRTSAAREAVFAAFARQGIDRTLADKLGELL